ncbi:biliverdin-producing heme oxygenase [Alteriqipengyuania sp. 357]
MMARCGNAPELRARLRAATHEQHQRLDTTLGRLDLADRGDYARFLKVQANARHGVEAWLGRYCPAKWLPPSQAALLAADLSALGDKAGLEDAPGFDLADQGPVAWLGAAWVLAGSSLGNRMMERELSARAPAGWPMAFLRDDAMPAYFKTLRPLLAQADPNPGAERIAAAVFAHFQREADRQLAAQPA